MRMSSRLKEALKSANFGIANQSLLVSPATGSTPSKRQSKSKLTKVYPIY